MNRRTFFSNLVSLAGLAVISTWWSQALAERKRGSGAAPAAGGKKDAAAEIKMVDPKSTQATAVKYVENKAEIKDAALKADRQGLKFDQQKCQNCSFYSVPKQHGGSEVGLCQIFPGQHVKAEGWCASWNKKA